MFFEINTVEGGGGGRRGEVNGGTHDRTRRGESKSTICDQFWTRLLVRVCVRLAGPFMRVQGGEKGSNHPPRGAGHPIGLL